MSRIKSQLGNELLILFDIWMVFVVLSKLVLAFPHWEISFLALINYDLYFLIAILAVAIFLKDRYNKYLFLNLAIFSLIYVTGFFVLFVGKKYSIGDEYFQYYFWTYRKILISIVTCITIIYIPIDYLKPNKKTIIKYLLSFAITLPIIFIYYKNFCLSHRYLFLNENYYKIFSGAIGMNFLALFFIGLYGYLIFYHEKPISGFVNLIIFSLLIFITIDTVDNYFNYLHIELPALSHLFLMANLILFILILLCNFYYLHTEFGRFYENYKFAKPNLNIKILNRRTIIERYVILLQDYFKHPPHRVFFIILMVISLLFFLYFYPYGYSKLSFLTLVMMIIFSLGYLNMLVKKRIKLKILNKN